jgi:poly(A) polymerase
MNVTQKPHLHQDWIDPHAIGIVRALQKKGYPTFLVGGCVRDLLLNIQPKDYDIATDARPEQVKSTIHRSYIIGKRFRLVLVRRDESQFEVATFRRELREDEPKEDQPEGDNVFGTPEEDARRRDFTINGLFYDPIKDELIDYAEGLPDLEQRWVRMIGDPRKRLVEDPIRILRALRLKHMIEFALDPDLRAAMTEMAHTLPTTVLPRRREEILKLLRLRHPEAAFLEAHDMGVMKHLSPTLAKALDDPERSEDLLRGIAQIGATERAGLSPADLFGLLVHAYVRTFLQTEPNSSTRGWSEDEEFQGWMRDELGMFKFEQALALKALHVEPLLARRKEFQRKGERRQRALLTNEAFPLAMLFATKDFCLSCEDHLYWTQAFAQIRAEGPMPSPRDRASGGDSNGRPRRRRTRPRRGGGRGDRAPKGEAGDSSVAAES